MSTSEGNPSDETSPAEREKTWEEHDPTMIVPVIAGPALIIQTALIFLVLIGPIGELWGPVYPSPWNFFWVVLQWAIIAAWVCSAIFGIAIFAKNRPGEERNMGLGCLGVSLLVVAVMSSMYWFTTRDYRYQCEFQSLATEYRELLRKAYEQRLARENVGEYVEIRGERSEEKGKIAWFELDRDADRLHFDKNGGSYWGIDRSLFTDIAKEVAFVVVQAEFEDRRRIIIFHVPTKSIVADTSVTPYYETKRSSEVVIPGPGAGREIVDQKFGPVGVRERVSRRAVYPRWRVAEFVHRVVGFNKEAAEDKPPRSTGADKDANSQNK